MTTAYGETIQPGQLVCVYFTVLDVIDSSTKGVILEPYSDRPGSREIINVVPSDIVRVVRESYHESDPCIVVSESNNPE